MAQRIEDIMTRDVHCVPAETTLRECARIMRDKRIGDVLVTDPKGKLCGIVTDRDIVVRAVAEGKDLDTCKVGDIRSGQLVKLAPDAPVDEAVRLMRENAIRRIPVVQDDVPVGIVSIGDLAAHKDPRSALGQISKAAPNN